MWSIPESWGGMRSQSCPDPLKSTLNSSSFCFHLTSPGMTGPYHNTWLEFLKILIDKYRYHIWLNGQHCSRMSLNFSSLQSQEDTKFFRLAETGNSCVPFPHTSLPSQCSLYLYACPSDSRLTLWSFFISSTLNLESHI